MVQNENYLNAVTRINELVNVQRVVDMIDMTPSKSTPEYKLYSCPFHSDTTPSFYVNESRNVFNCFACSRKGSTYKLTKEYLEFTNDRRVSLNEIILWLSDINPSVKTIQFVVHVDREINKNKKSEFLASNKGVLPQKITVCTPEDKRLFISGVMKGLDDDTLIKLLKFGSVEIKEDDLFNQLMEDF